MSTLQHTLQPAFRNRVALMIVLAGTLAALTVALIVAGGGSSTPAPAAHPSQATIERQLEAVSSARYGIQRSQPAAPRVSAEDQLQAVNSARNGVQVGTRTSH
jgi:hypothetical protein